MPADAGRIRLRRTGADCQRRRRLPLDERRGAADLHAQLRILREQHGAAAGEGGVQITGVRDPILSRVTSPQYRGFDLEYPDVDRVKVVLKELAEYEKSGSCRA